MSVVNEKTLIPISLVISLILLAFTLGGLYTKVNDHESQLQDISSKVEKIGQDVAVLLSGKNISFKSQ